MMDIIRDEATGGRSAETAIGVRELLATIDLAALFVHDLDGRIRFWSGGCETLYGWAAAEAVGRPAQQLLGAAFPIPPQQITARLLACGEWSGEVRHHRRDGTPLTISVRQVLRRAADGRSPVVLESVIDVTALRQAEAALHKLKQELAACMRSEAAARARAARAERMQALGELASGIAHDFNNLLQAILTRAAAIEARPADVASVQRSARSIVKAVERGAAVTRRLLIFARRGDLRTEPMQAVALLEEMREILAHMLHRGVTVAISAEPGLPAFLADRGQLETTLVNLATNARDAMPQGGQISLRAHAETVNGAGHRAGLAHGHYVALTVADTGTGMSDATIARAMEPFFTTKGPERGTGLGLAIAQSFAEQSKGGIAIASTPGHGTAVTVWLPAATQAVAAARSPPPAGREPPQTWGA